MPAATAGTQSIAAALEAGGTAVITGGASGIGLATAKKLAARGLKVVIADRESAALYQAIRDLALIAPGGGDDVLAFACDVASRDDVGKLADATLDRYGAPSFLMNNAGIGSNPGKPWEDVDAWRALIDVNFWGVVHGVAAFVPKMIEAGRPGVVVNTGSKQGITTPPGNLCYNVSKSALKTYTEGLAHELRNIEGSQLSAHLLIPGFTFTGLTVGSVAKPAGAWTAEQVADFMFESLARGDFYILCPDNETERATDERRMAWAVGDIIENRPALSRWHPDYKDKFTEFLKK
jgi:NAD(P)-dependent dehydrogenase (short-subunit alcohol dehydrogenase family)